ncbi:MAG TPA: glycosyltransferase family 9 protein, partial [Syntrophales bacterium]|nr:glycosyltransferase family 9 protein [Syntrophales bacterium]
MVVSLAGIGDLLLATPMIRKVSEISGKPVDVLTTAVSLPVLDGNPWVRNVFFMKGEAVISAGSGTLPVSEFLNNNSFSVVVSARSTPGLLRAITLSEKPVFWCENPIYERLRLTTRLAGWLSESRRKRFHGSRHMARLLWEMVPSPSPGQDGKGLDKPFMFPPGKASSTLAALWGQEEAYVVVHAGGKDPIRKLTAGVLSGIVSGLGKDRVVLVGGAEDIDLGVEMKKRHPGLWDMTGRLGLGEVFLLLKHAAACIAPDSAIMHMAAAAGTPLVALMGNALPETYGPLCGGRSVVLSRRPPCSPCNRRVCGKYGGLSC